jgi:hypothetical protein
MTPAQTQMFISYVVNYANIAKNHIHENSIDAQSIEASLNQISTVALVVIDRINKGDIADYTTLVEACSPIGDAFFDQLCNDKQYEYHMNEWAERQKEFHEIPY